MGENRRSRVDHHRRDSDDVARCYLAGWTHLPPSGVFPVARRLGGDPPGQTRFAMVCGDGSVMRGILFGILATAVWFPDVVWTHERPSAPPQSRKCSPQIAPLHTGGFSGASDLPMWRREEAEPWRGGGWLGWKTDGDVLRPVQFVIRDAPAAIEDYAELTVQSVPIVDFAVRCIQGLRAGPIRSVVTEERDLIYDGPLTVDLENKQYKIYVKSARKDLSDTRVLLTQGAKSQVLYSANGFVDEPHFVVVWAGDLDRDGRLDLIVNLHRKYSWHPYRLLLSSRASASQLVGQAAVFEIGD